MNGHLAKAKGAIDQIREISEGQFDGTNPKQLDLMMIARIQAELASAEALERIADRLDSLTVVVHEQAYLMVGNS